MISGLLSNSAITTLLQPLWYTIISGVRIWYLLPVLPRVGIVYVQWCCNSTATTLHLLSRYHLVIFSMCRSFPNLSCVKTRFYIPYEFIPWILDTQYKKCKFVRCLYHWKISAVINVFITIFYRLLRWINANKLFVPLFIWILTLKTSFSKILFPSSLNFFNCVEHCAYLCTLYI